MPVRSEAISQAHCNLFFCHLQLSGLRSSFRASVLRANTPWPLRRIRTEMASWPGEARRRRSMATTNQCLSNWTYDQPRRERIFLQRSTNRIRRRTIIPCKSSKYPSTATQFQTPSRSKQTSRKSAQTLDECESQFAVNKVRV